MWTVLPAISLPPTFAWVSGYGWVGPAVDEPVPIAIYELAAGTTSSICPIFPWPDRAIDARCRTPTRPTSESGGGNSVSDVADDQLREEPPERHPLICREGREETALDVIGCPQAAIEHRLAGRREAHQMPAAIRSVAPPRHEAPGLECVHQRDHRGAIDPKPRRKPLLQRRTLVPYEHEDRKQPSVDVEGRQGGVLQRLEPQLRVLQQIAEARGEVGRRCHCVGRRVGLRARHVSIVT